MTFHPAGGGTYNLNSSIGSTDTSLTLTSFTEPVSGTPYTMVLLNTSIVYATIAPKTDQSEFISFTGITQNADGTATLTGVTRGLAKKYPFTTDSTFKLPHSGQSQFILSDAPQLFEKYVNVDNDITINGLITFAQPPVGINPGGQPNASTTISGIVQEATTAQVNAGTATGSTGAVLFASPADLAASIYGLQLPTSGQKSALVGDNTDIAVGSGNKFVTQTGLQHSAEQYAVDSSVSANTITITLAPVPTSYTAGMTLRIKVANSITGATVVNVNGLGNKNLTKQGILALVQGDVIATQVIAITYDGTQFQLQNMPLAYQQGNEAVSMTVTHGSNNTSTGFAITTDGTQRLYVSYNGNAFFLGDNAVHTETVSLLVDSSVVATYGMTMGGTSTSNGFNPNASVGINFVTAVLSAASHTIQLKVADSTSGTSNVSVVAEGSAFTLK